MSFEIIKTLSVSLEHLTCKDYTLIEEYNDFITEYDRYIIIVEDAMNNNEYYARVGFSDGFLKSILMAYILGCERVEFSYEGSIIEGIPVYSS